MRAFGPVFVFTLLITGVPEARSEGDVFTVSCGGRMYQFANERVVGASDFNAIFTVDLKQMQWARKPRPDTRNPIRQVRGSWIFLTDQKKSATTAEISETLNRESLKYRKNVEFHPFREEYDAQCRAVPLRPLG